MLKLVHTENVHYIYNNYIQQIIRQRYTNFKITTKEPKWDKFISYDRSNHASMGSGVTTMGSDRENPGAPNLNGPNGGPQV
jgi:5-methylcytosine-specific restriction endonuclease McrBC regulatory subunit McrC